jgi:hypothetical protein
VLLLKPVANDPVRRCLKTVQNTELMVYDNSAESDPHLGQPPQPIRLLHYRDGKILYLSSAMPEWAKPIAAVALGLAT